MKKRKNIRIFWINKKANMVFSIYILALLLISLSTISYVTVNRFDDIELKTGLIQNNIELLNSRIDAERYFFKSMGTYLKPDAEYGLINGFSLDITAPEDYRMNMLLDSFIENEEKPNDLNDKEGIVIKNKQKNSDCSYLGVSIVKEGFECFNNNNLNALSYLKSGFSKYMLYYNRSKGINFSDKFNYAIDYSNDGIIINGFMDSVVKSIKYSSIQEYEKWQMNRKITKESDGFIKTDIAEYK